MDLINVGVKALLNWVNSIELSEQQLHIDDLQDGTYLLNVVHKLKNEQSIASGQATEERFKRIAEFLQRDCRFSPDIGASLSWDNIRNGVNLTIEISKVLLLLVYHDMMNERCTLNQLEYNVEREIANLTDRFVLEVDGCVYLSVGIEAYLGRKYLSVSMVQMEGCTPSTPSSHSTLSSLSDESPVFMRSQKVKFVDLQMVASSTVRSPLQEVMNTPQFQMRKMQRQMIQEREYRDGLVRELASKMTLITQRESHINQLQYHLDKMKEEQSEQEQFGRDQIDDLETKNNSLQSRCHDLLRQNQDLKTNSSQMECRMDKLAEENGMLSAQVRDVCSQIANSKAEVQRLMESQESAQQEWSSQTCYLQTELDQATAQKDFMNETIEILHSKILSLEDTLNKVANEEKGENMGPIMEREVMESTINDLKNQLENAVGSLRQAEEKIDAKAVQLAEYQQEITLHKELLKQQLSKSEGEIQAKEEILVQIQKDTSEQRKILQEEIQTLHLQVEKTGALHIKAQEDAELKDEQQQQEIAMQREALQHQKDAYEGQVRRLQAEIQHKQEQMEMLKTDSTEQLALLYQEMEALKNQVESLGSSLKTAEELVQTNENLLAKQKQDASKIHDVLQAKISMFQEEVKDLKIEVETLQGEVERMSASIKVSEEEIKVKELQLAQIQQEKAEQRDMLEKRIAASEEELEKLRENQRETENCIFQAKEEVVSLQTELSSVVSLSADKDKQLKVLREEVTVQSNMVSSAKEKIEIKEEMLTKLQKESSDQTEALQHEIQDLKSQVESHVLSLKNAEQEIGVKKDLLRKQQEQGIQQREELQGQMFASAEVVRKLNIEVQHKEEEMLTLKNEASVQCEVLQQEIQSLKNQVESLADCLRKAEEQLQAQVVLLTRQEQESAHQKKLLQKQVSAAEEEVKMLKEDMHSKELQLQTVMKEGSQQSTLLHQQIQDLNTQLGSLSALLREAEAAAQAKGALLTEKQQKSEEQVEAFQKELAASQEEVVQLHKVIQAKEEHLIMLKSESSTKSEVQQQEINDLKTHLESIGNALKKAEEDAAAKEDLLAKNHHESAQQKEVFDKQLFASQEEVKRLTLEIGIKEEEASTKEMVFAKNQQDAAQKEKTLQEQIVFTEGEIEKLKTSQTEKENLVFQCEEKIASLQTELSTVVFISADKDKQLEVLRQENSMQTNLCDKTKAELQAKKDELVKVQVESSKESEGLIQALKTEMVTVSDTLKRADDMVLAKEQQLQTVMKEGAQQSTLLHQQIQDLNTQLGSLSALLRDAEAAAQAKGVLLTEKQQKSEEQVEAFQKELAASHEEVVQLHKVIQAKEEHLIMLKSESSTTSEAQQQEINDLKTHLESIGNALKKAEEDAAAKEDLLAKNHHESAQQKEVFDKQLFASQEEVKRLTLEIGIKEEEASTNEMVYAKIQQETAQKEKTLQEQIVFTEGEIEKLKTSQTEKENLVFQCEEKIASLQTELSTVVFISADKDKQLEVLRQEVSMQTNLCDKTKAELQAKKDELVMVQVESSKERDGLIQALKTEMVTVSDTLKRAEDMVLAKEHLLTKTQEESAQQIEQLKQQLASVHTYLNHHKEAHDKLCQEKAALEELQQITLMEKEALLQEKEALAIKLLQAEQSRGALEKQLEHKDLEKEKLAQAKQAIDRENEASRTLESALQHELASLRWDKKKLGEELEKLNKGLREELAVKSEAAEHYKAQMDKAVSHYNGKKQLLLESQKQVGELQHSLELKEHEVKAATGELQLLQLDLEKVQNNENNILSRVASLEAQLAFADRSLREQNKMRSDGGRPTESVYSEATSTKTRLQTRAQMESQNTSDSLEQSSLDDSLNTTRRPSAPEESSTPLVRSSERLAAKRKALGAESLDTLYFTPMNNGQNNRTSTKCKLDSSLASLGDLVFDSVRNNPTSSVKRRRTTQVINITMKKTPGRGGDEGDDTFHSLASARSQPNISSTHASQPITKKLFDTPVKMGSAASDQLLSLPGYRRSTTHSNANRLSASTFCVGAENEPENVSDDWMRIAELQSRNKACLPHLKSSYPLESRSSIAPSFIFTDEELRMGDPSETMRRASMMPGQLQDSLNSHRLSLMVGQNRSHRASLMPGQLPSRNTSSCQMQSARATKQLRPQMSPEVKASCFPRPLTPRNKKITNGPSSQRHTALSPAGRRESVMFTVDNTPKKNSYLQRSLNKLRSSTRKSPAKTTSRKSPGNPTPTAAVGRVVRRGSVKSPKVQARAQRKSPRVTSSTAKSPGLTASARKMMGFRLKV